MPCAAASRLTPPPFLDAMNTHEESYEDQMMDALLHEQARTNREQAIQEVENAIMADVVSHVPQQPGIDWKRLIVSGAIAASVVLGFGYFLSNSLIPKSQKAASQGYTVFHYTYETGKAHSKAHPPRELINKRPGAPNGSVRGLSASMAIPFPAIPSLELGEGGHYAWYIPDPNAVEVLPDANVDANPNPSQERYASLVDQVWRSPWTKPLSTFSIDVEHASYSEICRLIGEGSTVPADAVRIEECINAFDYAYRAPTNGSAFAIHSELMTCPWNENNVLVKMGIKGSEVGDDGGLPSKPIAIAKDVKLLVEFNPQRVAAYRLIGYANQVLKSEDLDHGPVSADDIVSGHTVTAFYEIVPAGAVMAAPKTRNGLKYQKPLEPQIVISASKEWLNLKLRHKHPESDASFLLESVIEGEATPWQKATSDSRFAAAVALFGMKLRGMDEVVDVSWDQLLELAQPGLRYDSEGNPQQDRTEFIGMVSKLRSLSR